MRKHCNLPEFYCPTTTEFKGRLSKLQYAPEKVEEYKDTYSLVVAINPQLMSIGENKTADLKSCKHQNIFPYLSSCKFERTYVNVTSQHGTQLFKKIFLQKWKEDCYKGLKVSFVKGKDNGKRKDQHYF